MLHEMWQESGKKPDALANRPTLHKRWNIPYSIWVEISGSRNYHAAGAAEIPFSEFFLWAIAHDYTKAELVCMWEDVHTVDRVWLSEAAKIRKEQAPAKKP